METTYHQGKLITVREKYLWNDRGEKNWASKPRCIAKQITTRVS